MATATRSKTDTHTVNTVIVRAALKEHRERRFITEKKLAEISGRSVRGLQGDRLLGRGFPFYRLGEINPV